MSNSRNQADSNAHELQDMPFGQTGNASENPSPQPHPPPQNIEEPRAPTDLATIVLELSIKVNKLEATVATLKAENANLKKENANLKKENANLKKEKQELNNKIGEFIDAVRVGKTVEFEAETNALKAKDKKKNYQRVSNYFYSLLALFVILSIVFTILDAKYFEFLIIRNENSLVIGSRLLTYLSLFAFLFTAISGILIRYQQELDLISEEKHFTNLKETHTNNLISISNLHPGLSNIEIIDIYIKKDLDAAEKRRLQLYQGLAHFVNIDDQNAAINDDEGEPLLPSGSQTR